MEGAPSSKFKGAFRPSVEVRPPRLRANGRRQRLKGLGAGPCVGNTEVARGAFAEMLPWIGAGDPFRTAGKTRWTSLFGADLWTANQKSPLRRCFKPRPPLSAGCAGFASGCRSRSEALTLRTSGDCPASCPDAYRSTHGHRHVRIWASGT